MKTAVQAYLNCVEVYF